MAKKKPSIKQQKQILNKKLSQAPKSQKAKKQQHKAREKLQKINKREKKQILKQKDDILYRKISATEYINHLKNVNYGTEEIQHYIDDISYEYVRELQNGGYDLFYQGKLNRISNEVRIVPHGQQPSNSIKKNGHLYAMLVTSISGRGQRLNTWALDPKIKIVPVPSLYANMITKTSDKDDYRTTFNKINEFYSNKPWLTLGYNQMFIELLGIFYE